MTGPGETITLPPFAFRIEAAEVIRYRAALGAGAGRVPLGLAMGALARPQVAETLTKMADGRIPVHVGQSCHLVHPLRPGVDYIAEVVISRPANERARMALSLQDDAGQTCLRLSADIVLVTT